MDKGSRVAKSFRYSYTGRWKDVERSEIAWRIKDQEVGGQAMNCDDYICNDEACKDICDNCDRMKEKSCINCALSEDCDGEDAFHDPYY